MDLYVYAGIALFGFLFILVSFIMGEIGHFGSLGDAGIDHDVGVGHAGIDHDAHIGDVDADHDGVGDTGDHDAPGPLSMRVVAMFLTTFGAVAAAARWSGLQSSTSAVLGMASGYALGWCMWRFMRLLWAQGGTSLIRTQDLEGCVAEVTVAIPASGPGQIACVAEDVRTYQIACSANGEEIPLGSTVRIARVISEGVIVERMAGDATPASEEFRRRMHDA